MVENTPKTSLPALAVEIAVKERETAALRQVQQILVEFPELAGSLRRALGGTNGSGGYHPTDPPIPRAVLTTIPASEAQGTYFDRVCDFFRARDNLWATAPQIGAATGIARGG